MLFHALCSISYYLSFESIPHSAQRKDLSRHEPPFLEEEALIFSIESIGRKKHSSGEVALVRIGAGSCKLFFLDGKPQVNGLTLLNQLPAHLLLEALY